MTQVERRPRQSAEETLEGAAQQGNADPRNQFTSKQSLRQADWSAIDWATLNEAYTFGAAAAVYAAAGIPVFPVGTDKKPLTPQGFYNATTDAKKLAAWTRKYPQAGIAIPTGEASGVFVVDVDVDKGGDYDTLAARFELPDTLVSETGGGGQHLFFVHPGFPVKCGVDELGKGYDIRGDGGYIVAPNSLHQSGKRYQWLFMDTPVAAPDELLALLRPSERPRSPLIGGRATYANGSEDHQQAGLYWLNRYLPDARDHNRNNAGFYMMLQLRDEGLSYAEAKPFVLQYVAAVPDTPGDCYTEREALATLQSVYSRPARERARALVVPISSASRNGRFPETDGAGDPPGGERGGSDHGDETPSAGHYHLTEMGNAERLIAQYGPQVRYCYLWRKWLVWDGKRWADDTRGRTTRFAKVMVRAIYREAADEPDDEKRKEINKHAARSESDKAIRAALSLAQSDAPVQPDELDSEATSWLLNFQNGTVDLRTGNLLEHAPAHLITKITRADYNRAAECPTWLKFLGDIMGGNQQLITFLQRAVGYSLTGSTREQVFFIAFGSGQNGKSTFLDVLGHILADYAMHSRPETFMVRPGDPIPNDVARLKGARFVSTVETEDGQRLAEARIKNLTGSEPVTASFKYAEEFTFRPSLKLWMATNHKPVIRGTDNAIWRRIRLIPFAVTIDKPDKDLADKLKAEAAGILAWAVQGCLDWQRDGLTSPPEVQTATEAYRDDMDIIRTFVAERCTEADTARITVKELYTAYQAWCAESGERPIGKQKFNDRLRERGLDSFAGNRNQTTWLGIGLLDNQTE